MTIQTTSKPKKVTLERGQTLVIKVDKLDFEMAYKEVCWLVLNRIIDKKRPKVKPSKKRPKEPLT